jgi:phosphoglycerate dehydrogenase-like enzyme
MFGKMGPIMTESGINDREPVEVLITLPFSDDLMDRIRTACPEIRIRAIKASRPEEIPAETWATTEVLYTARVLPAPEAAPDLRWIQFHYAGVDHAREAALLRRDGLAVTTLSGAAASQLAEYILMMLLSLGHRLPEIIDHQRRSVWPKDRWERFSPLELRNSTVGIIGYGSIGRQTARLLHPFGAQVLANKWDARHPEDPGYSMEGLGDPDGDFVHRLYPPTALHSMVRDCDYVVVCVPLTPATRGLVDKSVLASMPQSAYLVDVSRGGVVDHAALVDALRERQLAGAALDVFPEEPLPPDSPLWKFPNVILSPHISGNTPHYDQRAVDLFIVNLKRYLSGQRLLNLVDLERGY